jgi:hypothetical protein
MKRSIRRINCPICNSILIEYGSKEVYGTCYSYNKETLSKCQNTELVIERGLLQLESHFKVEARDGVSYYETFYVYPFIIHSYDDVSNIYHYHKDRDNKKLIAEVPYLDLPWSNKEKVLQKLKLYTLFS